MNAMYTMFFMNTIHTMKTLATLYVLNTMYTFICSKTKLHIFASIKTYPLNSKLPMSRHRLTYKWELIALLWATFFLGQCDRQVFSVVLPLIREDLNLSDAQMGLIATIMMIALGFMAPIAGRLADIRNKKHILIFSTCAWAFASLFTGMSTALFFIIVFRAIAAGPGEAFYGPAAFASIARWHKESRSTAMAIHQTALYLGVIIAGYGAGYLGETYGWRIPFFLSGCLGLVLAGLLWIRMKNDSEDNVYIEPNVNWQELLVIFRSKRSVFYVSMTFAGMVFATVGYTTWMPTFLHEEYQIPLSLAGFHAMFWHHLAAFIGVLIGGKWTDKKIKHTKTARLDVQIVALLCAVPFIIWMGQGSSLVWACVALAGFGLFRGIYDSNIFATVFDVLPSSVHGMVVGVMTLLAFVVGSGSPVILGWLKPHIG